MGHRYGAVPLLAALLLAACASEPAKQSGPAKPGNGVSNSKTPVKPALPPARIPHPPATMQSRIVRLLPPRTQDRNGWGLEIVTALASQGLAVTDENVCSVLAVAEQESGFQGDPVVPGLGKIAWQEIGARAGKLHIPVILVRAALSIPSPTGKSYTERLDNARTEQELSLIFEDMIGMVPMGKTLFGEMNPVHTGGPMQVSIAFAEANASGYPYPVKDSIRHEVFSRRGGIWYGTRHLLNYSAPYQDHLYRYADFNAGWYASRNAAFQSAVSHLSGQALALDGDLIRYDTDAAGKTELALYRIADKLAISEEAIHSTLKQGDTAAFGQSTLYSRVFKLADQAKGRPWPRAVLPGISLQSPKITRKLTTAWFAKRVKWRQQTCLKRLGSL